MHESARTLGGAIAFLSNLLKRWGLAFLIDYDDVGVRLPDCETSGRIIDGTIGRGFVCNKIK